MIKFVTPTDTSQVQEMAKTAISTNLYIPGWSLLDILNSAITRPETFHLVGAFDDDRMVGVACLERLTFVSVFVHPEFRQRGIATKMLEKLHVDEMCECRIGEPQSKKLFENFNLYIQDLYE